MAKNKDKRFLQFDLFRNSNQKYFKVPKSLDPTVRMFTNSTVLTALNRQHEQQQQQWPRILPMAAP
jgi:hypothetical protein